MADPAPVHITTRGGKVRVEAAAGHELSVDGGAIELHDDGSIHIRRDPSAGAIEVHRAPGTDVTVGRLRKGRSPRSARRGAGLDRERTHLHRGGDPRRRAVEVGKDRHRCVRGRVSSDDEELVGAREARGLRHGRRGVGRGRVGSGRWRRGQSGRRQGVDRDEWRPAGRGTQRLGQGGDRRTRHGPAVDPSAARIVDLAGPGEVLCSEATADVIGARRGVGFEPLGPVFVGGITEPVPIVRVLSAARPPTPARGSASSEVELVGVVGSIRRPGARRYGSRVRRRAFGSGATHAC